MLRVIRKFYFIFLTLCSSILVTSCLDNDNFQSQPGFSSYQGYKNQQSYRKNSSALSDSQRKVIETYDELASSVWLAVGSKNTILKHNYIRFATDHTFGKSYFSLVVDEPTKIYQRQRFLGSIHPIGTHKQTLSAFFYRPVACASSKIAISKPQRNWQENTVRSINVTINQTCAGELFPNIIGAKYIHKPLTFLNKSDLIHQDIIPNS